MKIVEISLRRRVTVSMCAVALVLFGGVAFTRLPINLLPDVSYPTLTVETRFPGAAPAEVESLVSRPVEEAAGVVAGVKKITSVSKPGLSQVTLEFEWGRNMDFAALDVRQKLDLLTLAREAEKPVILRFDPSNDPIVRLYLTGLSESTDLYRLRYVAEEVLKRDLESADGVAAIQINGGYEEEIEVRIDEGKLSLLGLSIDEVRARLLQENINQAGGSLYESEARYLVRARNEFQNLDDILTTILATHEGRNVTLADVAEVTRGHKRREVITRFGGREAVELALYKEGDANTVAVAKALHERLDNVRKELPEGVEVVVGADQSRFIRASIDEVIDNALLGGLIAIGVLLLFLKDLRSTLIIAVTIPVSIVATFFLMYQTGTTLNVMSLGGLALGVGMLVDGAIVVLEAIHKRREKGESGVEAARNGASEVGMAVIASVLTTVVVFVPVVFVEGMAAQLFRDQAVTVSISLLASLVISLTLIPLMAAGAAGRLPSLASVAPDASAPRRKRVFWAVFHRAPAAVLGGTRRGLSAMGKALGWLFRPVTRTFDAALAAVTAAYPPTLRWALRSKVTVLGLGLALFVASLFLIPVLGVNLVPSFSQGEFSFRVELPEGTPLETTDRFVAEAQEVLEGDPRIDSYASTSGGSGLSLSSSGSEGEGAARIQVRMKPGTSPEDEEAVAAKLRERLAASELARFEFERPSYFTFRTPIEAEVYGDDLAQLHTASAELRRDMEDIQGLVDVRTTAELGNPELQVAFNREQLSRLGLDLSQVADTVRSKVQGTVATRFQQGDREIDIRVRSVEMGTASVDDLSSLIVGQRDGVPIPLSAVATVTPAEGPSEIRRIGQKRAAVISGNLAGRSMGEVATDVRAAIRRMSLPPGVTASLSGQEEEMQRSFRSLTLAGLLALFLVYLVMACEFESLIHPFVVMFTVPLGAIGTIGALALTGHSIDVVAILGAVMLAGIVVDNAIVLIDGVNQLRDQGMSKERALLEGGLNRLRPILMTSACTVLGLLPMAFGIGEGGELQRPLAITVIGGLTVGTVLTLVVIPVVYTLLDRKAEATVTNDVSEAVPSLPEGVAS
ncbi:MAG TPA: efflux RND transporter permease subunit [Thermoanaerobaculia bacterium]|nr:efflux RND transporter permease subunit [Thermoanaerobaculia bacterium]